VENRSSDQYARARLCRIGLMTALRQGGSWQQAAREFAALGLWALAVYILLSLFSRDIRCESNLGARWGTLSLDPWNTRLAMRHTSWCCS
jgi:hypothetical protein